MAEAEAASPPAAAPADQCAKKWEYDPEARAIRAGGKEFKLQISLEDLGTFSSVVNDYSKAWLFTVEAQQAVKDQIAGFTAGKWPSYKNAGQRIKALRAREAELDQEVVVAKQALTAAASEFGKLFKPEGLYAELAGDEVEWAKLIKHVLREVAKR